MTDKKPTRAEQLAAEGHIVKPCKGCGKPMVWARTPTDNWIPLDPTPPVYSVVMGYDINNGYQVPHAVRNQLALVLHHVTCPNREQFKK